MKPSGWPITKFIDRVLPDSLTEKISPAWRMVHKVLEGLELTDEEREIFDAVSGGRDVPEGPVREFWPIIGRRGMKTWNLMLMVVKRAVSVEYPRVPGELVVMAIVFPNRAQARVAKRYASGILRSTPVLERFIVNETQWSIELSTGVELRIMTASSVYLRGYSIPVGCIDEVAFLPTDNAADPAQEIIRALRPAAATFEDRLLAFSGTPYATKGPQFEAHQAHFGKNSLTLVIKGASQVFNPWLDQATIDRAFAEDEVAAWSEYGRDGEIRFRSDVESFIGRDVLDAVTEPGCRERPPVTGVRYVGFIDFAGGSGQDSATLAAAHEERRCLSCGTDQRNVRGACCPDKDVQAIAVLDLVREFKPPFSPQAVCKDFAETLRRYRISTATADRYAGDFPVEEMQKHGVRVRPADKAKSDIYKELLPMLNSATVELLDVPRLHAQLAGLERRTARGGRDSIDHAPTGHDDLANAAAGALTLPAMGPQPVRMLRARWG